MSAKNFGHESVPLDAHHGAAAARRRPAVVSADLLRSAEGRSVHNSRSPHSLNWRGLFLFSFQYYFVIY